MSLYTYYTILDRIVRAVFEKKKTWCLTQSWGNIVVMIDFTVWCFDEMNGFLQEL